jgi:outer membrane protein OmpA-like peptidoglycan-associated protein
MLDALRPRLALALIAAAALAACTTPVVEPQLSQAVIDARAHRDVPPEGACPETALNTISPLFVGFPFGESKLDDTLSRTLDDPIRWLTCHAGVPVVVRPDADSHGTDAEQDALAQQRAEAVRNYLIAHRVPAGRIRILRRNEAAPTGQVFLINAEGRRW